LAHCTSSLIAAQQTRRSAVHCHCDAISGILARPDAFSYGR
jgi:hypothetical protein